MADIEEKYEKLLNLGDQVHKQMEENDGKITDEQVSEIAKALDSSAGEDESISSLKNIQEAPVVATNIEPKNVTVAIDSTSGIAKIVGEAQEEEHTDVDLSKYMDMSKYEKETVDIGTADNQSLADTYDIPLEDVAQIIPVLKRVQNKENFSVYSAFPESMQRNIDKIAAANSIIDRSEKNRIARDIANSMLTDIASDLFTVDIDKVINNEVQKAFEESNMSEMYAVMITGRKEKLYELAKQAEEQGETAAANQFREIGDACEESYKMTKFKEALRNHAIKIKKFDMEKPEKVFSQFCFKYQNTKLGINNVTDIIYCIPRYLGIVSADVDTSNVTRSTIVAFAVAFCNYCKTYTPDNVAQHTFMYYFIKNILSLDINVGEKQEFYIDLIENIVDCMNIIHEVYGY